MGALNPIAFDIETAGLEPSATITVAGLATDMGAWLALNTTGREADSERLAAAVEHESGTNVRISTHPDEQSLLTALGDFAHERIDGDRHYLTAYHGETWKGGFDLPFLRRACVRRDVNWTFPDVAYADVMTVCERFNTGDVNDPWACTTNSSAVITAIRSTRVRARWPPTRTGHGSHSYCTISLISNGRANWRFSRDGTWPSRTSR